MGMFWVYVLQNPVGRFYIGQTDELPARLLRHNENDTRKYTNKNGPWALVWSEAHETRSSAVKRERQVKRMKSATWIRPHLLNGRVPTRRD